MATAVARDERKVTVKKKSGSAVTNWSVDDHSSGPGSGDGVLVLEPPGLDRIIDKLFDESIGGEVAQAGQLNGGVRSEFTLSQHLRYEDLAGHLPFAMVIGSSGGSPSNPGGSGATVRDQTLSPAVNVNGLVATVCMGPTASQAAESPSASIVPSAMPWRWVLSGEGGALLQLESEWYGIDTFLKPAPSDDPLDSDITLTATEALIAAASLSSTGKKARMGDLTFFVDVNGGGDDFAGGSGQDYVQRISSFELAMERDLSWPDYGSQLANAPDTVSRPQMPVNNAQHVVPTLTITIPRHENDVFEGRWAQNVELRAWLEINGPTISGSFAYRHRIELPRIIGSEQNKDRGGNITKTYTFRCYEADSTPTGFTSADYLTWLVRNTQTSDLLA